MLAAAGSFNPVALGLNLGGLGLSTALGNPFGGTAGRQLSGAQLTSTHAASTSPGAHSPYSGPGQGNGRVGPPRPLCQSFTCLAQNKGDPSTGAMGAGSEPNSPSVPDVPPSFSSPAQAGTVPVVTPPNVGVIEAIIAFLVRLSPLFSDLAVPAVGAPATPIIIPGDSVIPDTSIVNAKGERGTTGKPTGTDNPFKHMRPHPDDASKVRFKHPHTGKMIDKPKPPGFDEWWKSKK